MSFQLLRSTLMRPVCFRTPQLAARACYHPPEMYSTKDEDFFITASYPDGFEPPTLVHKGGMGLSTWDEFHATLSEASVKADRGEATFHPAKRTQQDVEKFLQPDRLDPKMDEM